jgi:hypothetical protein
LFARRALLRWSATNSNNAKSGTCVFDNPASGLNVEDEKGVRMRRLVHIGLRALIIVPILSCSSMTVRADHDSQNDFSGYASFAIFARQGNEKKQPQMSPIVDRRIGDAMAAELRAKGFDTSSPHNADFLVTFYTAVRRRVVVHHGGWYGWRGWGWRGGTRWVNSYPEGKELWSSTSSTVATGSSCGEESAREPSARPTRLTKRSRSGSRRFSAASPRKGRFNPVSASRFDEPGATLRIV